MKKTRLSLSFAFIVSAMSLSACGTAHLSSQYAAVLRGLVQRAAREDEDAATRRRPARSSRAWTRRRRRRCRRATGRGVSRGEEGDPRMLMIGTTRPGGRRRGLHAAAVRPPVTSSSPRRGSGGDVVEQDRAAADARHRLVGVQPVVLRGVGPEHADHLRAIAGIAVAVVRPVDAVPEGLADRDPAVHGLARAQPGQVRKRDGGRSPTRRSRRCRPGRCDDRAARARRRNRSWPQSRSLSISTRLGMPAGERVEPGEVVGRGRERHARAIHTSAAPRPRSRARDAPARRAPRVTAPQPASIAISGITGSTWRTPMLVRDGMTTARNTAVASTGASARKRASASPRSSTSAKNPNAASAMTGSGVFTASAIRKNAGKPSWVSCPSRYEVERPGASWRAQPEQRRGTPLGAGRRCASSHRGRVPAVRPTEDRRAACRPARPAATATAGAATAKRYDAPHDSERAQHHQPALPEHAAARFRAAVPGSVARPPRPARTRAARAPRTWSRAASPSASPPGPRAPPSAAQSSAAAAAARAGRSP